MTDTAVYAHGDDYLTVYVDGVSPNDYEPDYAYSTDYALDLPTDDLSDVVGVEVLDRVLSHSQLARKGEWETSEDGYLKCSVVDDRDV